MVKVHLVLISEVEFSIVNVKYDSRVVVKVDCELFVFKSTDDFLLGLLLKVGDC